MLSKDDKYFKHSSSSKLKDKDKEKKDNKSGSSQRPDYDRCNDQWSEKPQGYNTFSPLNVSIFEILEYIQYARLNLLRDLNPMRQDPDQRDRSKYYHFHMDHNHYTSNCYDMKQQVEGLIRKGYLKMYICKKNRDGSLKEAGGKKDEKGERSTTPPKRND